MSERVFERTNDHCGACFVAGFVATAHRRYERFELVEMLELSMARR